MTTIAFAFFKNESHFQ